MTDWLGTHVRERATGRVGIVTADLPDADHDVLAVYFGPGRWNTYVPNQWSKAHIFDRIADSDEALDA